MANNNSNIPFRQLLLQYSNTAINILFPLVLFPYMTRTLGPEGYGVIGYYESLMSVVVLIAAFGVQYYGLRLLSKSAIGDANQANTVLHLILINLMMGLGGVLVYFLYILTKPVFIGSMTIACLYGLIMLQYSLHLDWYFQSQERFRLLFIRTLVARLMVLIAAFVFVSKPEHLIYYIIISTCNYLFISAVAVYNIRDLFPYWKWDPELIKKLFRALSPFALLGVLGTIYFAFDTILLARIGRVEDLGYYTVAAKIVRIGLNVFSGASIVFFVKLFRSEVNRTLQGDSLLSTLHLSYPIGAILYFFAEAVIFFVSGEQYGPSVQLLRIFSILWLVVPFHDFFSLQVLMVHHKERWILWMYLGTAVLSFLLNYLMIPIWFTSGAAWAIVLVESSVLVIGLIISRNYFRINREQFRELLGILLVFPVAWVVYRFSISVFSNNVMRLIAGTLLTLSIHIPIQIFLLKSRFWNIVWGLVRKRLQPPV